MDLSEKQFSIVPKMRTTIAFGLVLWIVCLVNTVRVALDFQKAFVSSDLLVKFAGVFLLFVALVIPLLFVFSPFRYRVVEGGVQIESLLRKTLVKFDEVEAVVMDIPSRHRKAPVERVVLFVGEKAYFLLGLASDFDQLRDYVQASLKSSIIDDRRNLKKA